MDLVYIGGQGVIWAGRFLGIPIPERVNVLDFFDELVKELKIRKTTIYLLGEKDSVIQKTADILKKKGLNIVGTHNGFFDEAQEKFIIQEINKLQPVILMVGMGTPKQEKWMFKHKTNLNVRLCWGVGGVFKLLCGDLKKAPKWVSNCGLEWLYLGLQDPKRLFKRYLIGNFIFVYHILRKRLTE
jgi:N-acetylglucosaminyldiphosphoundecaprenol N-acetyl-beta-D-mannosaminyltransferase